MRTTASEVALVTIAVALVLGLIFGWG